MNPLVSTTWLAGRIDDPGVAILDATLSPAGVAAALGVGDEMDIILNEQQGVFSGPRAWWILG